MRYMVFGATSLICAAAVILVGLIEKDGELRSAIPEVKLWQVRNLAVNVEVLSRQTFSGEVRGEKDRHWIRLRALPRAGTHAAPTPVSTPQPIRLELTLADGAGSPAFSGWVAPSSGTLHVYLEGSPTAWPSFRRISGVVRGPGLVNGVPTIHVQLSPIPVGSAEPDESRTWQGHLVVEKSR